jgi:hypothetical protein
VGTGGSSPEGKVAEAEAQADHSPPISAKAKKMWIYTSRPHTSSWRSAKHRDNFTLNLLKLFVALPPVAYKGSLRKSEEIS